MKMKTGISKLVWISYYLSFCRTFRKNWMKKGILKFVYSYWWWGKDWTRRLWSIWTRKTFVRTTREM